MKTVSFIKKFFASVISIFLLFSVLSNLCSDNSQWKIHNPYQGVNWVKDGRYKANIHCHTTESDGTSTPAEVVDAYRKYGYKILALTDHDTMRREKPTWPWQEYGRDPEKLGMIAIEGNEITAVHHHTSLFNNYGNRRVRSVDESLREIKKRGGIAFLDHPGRYIRQGRNINWYVDLFRRHKNLIGIEVYNQRDKYPEDRRTWDAILTKLLPMRQVWGFANDDMHRLPRDFGFSWNVFVLPELNIDQTRKAMENGNFYIVHVPKGIKWLTSQKQKKGTRPFSRVVPEIKDIIVDRINGTIKVVANGARSVSWWNGGKVVSKGNPIRLSGLAPDCHYVRAEIYGDHKTVTCTQPFSFSKNP